MLLTRTMRHMDMVTVRAAVHLSGFPLGETTTVVETPMVAGAIRKGALVLVERHTSQNETDQSETETPADTVTRRRAALDRAKPTDG